MSAQLTDHDAAFGRFVVQEARRRVIVDGRVARLSSRAFDILVTLIASDGRMVAKSALLDIVWLGQKVDEANIYVHVSTLRKLLGRDVIVTIPGRGYRFVHPPRSDLPAHHTIAVVGGRSRVSNSEREAEAAAAPAPYPTAGNLPISLPTLYGRGSDLATLSALLGTHRLVTLLGTGGMGKTSLALAAAHAERERGRWPDGVWFIDLAPIDDPEHVPTAVARSLGIALPAHAHPVQELAFALRPRAALLLLDNAEHLCEAAAALVTTLLAGSARLALLVTSRQALRVPSEQRFQVPPLTVPTDVVTADLRNFGAMALFEARAAAVDAGFRLNNGNSAAVADVCRGLDGIPLAIEFAAARVRVLGVHGTRCGLLASLRMLGPGHFRTGARHQTLRAAFEWSHGQLSPVERKLLRRLAVFVGGFTSHLAQQVGADQDDQNQAERDTSPLDSWGVLDALSELIDKSLVVAGDADPPRFRLLEVTRRYALDKLAEAGETDAWSARHAHAIYGLFAEVEAAKNEQIQDALSMAEYLRQLAPEVDNLRAARAWSRGPSATRWLEIGLVACSSEVLRMLGRSTEALQAMLPLRDVIDESVAPETAELFWTGLCALGTHGRLPSTQLIDLMERAEKIYRRTGSPRRMHLALYRKGFALMHLGRYDEARQSVQEMESLERVEWPAKAVALRLNLQAALGATTGRFEEAIDAFTNAARLLQYASGEDDFVLNTLANLCLPLLCTERHDEALSVARDVLRRSPTPAVRNSAERASLIALTFLGRLDEAAAAARQAMPGWRTDDMLPHMLSVFAWLAFQQGRVADSVRLDKAARLHGQRRGFSDTPVFNRARKLVEKGLNDRACTDAQLARWRVEGERALEDELVGWCLGDCVDEDRLAVTSR